MHIFTGTLDKVKGKRVLKILFKKCLVTFKLFKKYLQYYKLFNALKKCLCEYKFLTHHYRNGCKYN